MKNKKWVVFTLLLYIMLVGFTTVRFAAISETEPNDSTSAATVMGRYQNPVNGAIDPVGDVDYFVWPGVNSTWGYIALLDTSQSTGSKDGVLTAIRADEATVQDSDTGSWVNGSGIALQNYADGNDPVYFKVNEDGDNAGITNYDLRIYSTIISSINENEPNDTYYTGSVTSYTNAGVISTSGDKDCYRFEGRVGHDFAIALNSDPENNGGPVNYVLEFYDETGTLEATVNETSGNAPEFYVPATIDTNGVYAFCVSEASGTDFGADHTYIVGIANKNGLYNFYYTVFNTWTDPGAGNMSRVGDPVTFNFGITNDGLLPFPGDIRFGFSYDANCLEYLGATPASTGAVPGNIYWEGLFADLGVGETISAEVRFQAKGSCLDTTHGNVYIGHYLTGVAKQTSYVISWDAFLPMIIR